MKVSENPSLVSSERAQYLLKKWGPVLEYEKLSDAEYFEKYGRHKNDLKTAYLIESQESYFCSDDNKWKVFKDEEKDN